MKNERDRCLCLSRARDWQANSPEGSRRRGPLLKSIPSNYTIFTPSSWSPCTLKTLTSKVNLLKKKKEGMRGTSLVVQWLRLCLPVKGVQVLIPGQGAKIPHASRPKNQNIKQKQYCNKFNKDFKNGPQPKKKKTNKKKRVWETSGGDGYVYVIDCGDGFTGIYLSPNSSSCIY